MSPTAFIGWQTRYMVLTEHSLKYYKNYDEYLSQKHPKGII
jgi:hypothetical protein